jgi:endo-1,4-beta-xylanase
LAKLGKPIQITEFDVQMTNEALQADFTRDFLTTMFSHPSVNGVVMWGFWEGRHYAPSAALWRKDWTPKPNGKAWLDLVQKEWRTNENRTSDKTGELKIRAFQGDYHISVLSGNQTKELKLNLPKDGATLTVTLP